MINLERESKLYRKLINWSWTRYAMWVRRRWQRPGEPYADDHFARKGFKLGTLPESLVTAFDEAFPTAVPTTIRQEDFLPGYVHHPGLRPLEEKLNTDSVFYRPSSEVMNVVRRVDENLAEPVSKCLGAPFRLLNVRIIKTLPAAPKIGPYGWHSDGFPADILKIMIYFTPVGGSNGTTELRLTDGSEYAPAGPAGTWLLFRNTELVHRGIPPQNGARIAMELTVCPSLRQDNTPIFAGFNAAYPEFPWQLNPWLKWLNIVGFGMKCLNVVEFAVRDVYAWQKRLFRLRKKATVAPPNDGYQAPPQK